MVILTKTFLKKLAQDPARELAKLSVSEVVVLLQQLQQAYHSSGEPLVTDDIYDIVKEHLAERDPGNKVLSNVGAHVGEGSRKVRLPVWMGSLDKIKADERALLQYKTKSTKYLVTDKLDGISALLVLTPMVKSSHSDGKTTLHKLYTRGNGSYGQDISHLLPFLDTPKVKTEFHPVGSTLVVRGELIMSRERWSRRVSAGFPGANARNVVAGAVNAKVPDLEVVRLVTFVAYALIEPKVPTSLEEMTALRQLGFDTPAPVVVPAEQLTVDWLSAHLARRRKEAPFEIDGIVVSDEKHHDVVPGENPAHAFAFKHLLTQDRAEVVVVQVEWNVSKDGLLKPTVVFLPVLLSGVTIRRATGFNASFVKENVIGPGAHLLITRSGDVIPHIVEVLVGATSGAAQMPDVPFVWLNKDAKTASKTPEQAVQELSHFFDKMDVKNLGTATVRKLYDDGYTTVGQILRMETSNQKTNSTKTSLLKREMHAELLARVHAASCVEIMHASNAFGQGFGERKLNKILKSLPRLLCDDTFVPTLQELVAIDGVSSITADNFVRGLACFREFASEACLSNCFCNESGSKLKSEGPSQNKSNFEFRGQVVVFTGFRDKAMERKVTENGGTVATNVTDKTTFIIAKDPGAKSAKLDAARARGIPIHDSIDSFILQPSS